MMKKKLLSLLLASVTALSVAGGLAACNDGNSGTTSPKRTLATDLPTVASTEDPLASKTDEPTEPFEACTLTVWCPQAAIDTYTALVEEFKSDNYHNGMYKNVTVNFVAKAEGEVRTALATDPASGADVFFFEQGQISYMIEQNLLVEMRSSVGKYYTSAIAKRDSEASYSPVIGKNGYLCAFPATIDNGYFLWYDSEFYNENDIKTLDGMVSKAKAEGKHIMIDYANGWYAPTFWFGLGAYADYFSEEVDGASKEVYKTDFHTSDAGRAAGAAWVNYLSPANNEDCIIGPSSDLNSEIPAGMNAGSVVAGIIGTWVANDMPAKAKAAKLPTFTVKEDVGSVKAGQYQMGSFFGGKYCGVNSYSANQKVALALANYFTNEHGQAARFENTQAGPSNINVSNSEAVKANQGLAALAAQNAVGGYAQMSQPQGFWDGLKAFTDGCAKGTVTMSNLQKSLDDLAGQMIPKE